MEIISWNTEREGKRYRVYGSRRGWLGHSKWNRISSAIREDSNRFLASDIPGNYSLPRKANESAYLSIEQRWHIRNKTTIEDAPLEIEITPKDVRPVEGSIEFKDPDHVWYRNAFEDGIHLRYGVECRRSPVTKREVVITKAVSGNVSVTWRLRGTRVRTYVTTPQGLERPWKGFIGDRYTATGQTLIFRVGSSLDNESKFRGTKILPAKAWYVGSDGHRVEIDINLTLDIINENELEITKNIPHWFISNGFEAGAAEIISDDVSTFYPDEGPSETTSTDGRAGEGSNAVWATIRGDTGDQSNDTGDLYAFSKTTFSTDIYNDLWRSCILFDTSSLSPDTVSAATLGLYGSSSSNGLSGGSFGIALVSSSPASDTAIVGGDYDSLGSTRFSDSDVAYQSTPAGVEFTWSLNSSGIAAINTSGISKFGILLDYDLDDTPPTWASGTQDYMVFRSSEYIGTSNDPYLEVTHAAGGGGNLSPAASIMSLV